VCIANTPENGGRDSNLGMTTRSARRYSESW
jgi:hypothetical protein